MSTTYLTYDEYKAYGGTLAEADFTLFEFRARKRIDYLTASRVQAMAVIPEAVKLCMMSLIKVDGKYGVDAQIDNPVIASFNTDGYSESYGTAADQAAAVQKSMGDTIRAMLDGEKDDFGVPLLYRGVTGYAAM